MLVYIQCMDFIDNLHVKHMLPDMRSGDHTPKLCEPYFVHTHKRNFYLRDASHRYALCICKLRRPCQAGENLLPRLPTQRLSMPGLQLGSLSQQPPPPEELVSLLALTLSVTSAAPTFARTRKTPSSVKVLVECGTTGTALVFPDHNFRNLLQ